jgi:putative acyl-CoA dehydrogenase
MTTTVRERSLIEDVLNQPPPLEPYNTFDSDLVLVEALEREGGAWARAKASEVGRIAGTDAMAWGVEANRFPPVLRTHDRSGRRVDEVDFHPSWHHLMRTSVSHGLHALPWREERPGAFVARCAMYYAFTQAEQGHGCPITMTFAAVPALRAQPELARAWEPLLTSLEYDARGIVATQKNGGLAGMAMTERQGGSDVRANTTRATPAGPRTGPGAEYVLVGHKWFCSAPMCDVFLTLAHTDRGLTCFLVPRILPDGSRNAMRVVRLKDKLGNRSNASSEIEYHDALAWMVGEDGRGVRTIIEMVNHTRLDCVMGSAALMRQALAQALHHAGHRAAFGRRLAEQPLMQQLLADLAIESEAATTLLFRLARAYDAGRHDPAERALARLATAVAKFWVCKRAVTHVGECLECLGGGGYVEESILPRLYREAPVNSVWEGSGNVICLDVQRAIAREPAALGALLAELDAARGADARLDAEVDALRDALPAEAADEAGARRLVARLAVALQASLLVRHSIPAVADAFVASRVASVAHLYGSGPHVREAGAILARARPRVP